METNTLQTHLISKVKAMSSDQLVWLERVLNIAPFNENDTEDDLVKGMMLLQDTGGAFDFLKDEPDIYSVFDCPYIYASNSEQLIRHPSFFSTKN